MIYVPCPYCGYRNVDEFIYGGDISNQRPENPEEISDSAWCEYIYTVPNRKGVAKEIWWHKRGCNRWFAMHRDSCTDKIMPSAEESSDG